MHEFVLNIEKTLDEAARFLRKWNRSNNIIFLQDRSAVHIEPRIGSSLLSAAPGISNTLMTNSLQKCLDIDDLVQKQLSMARSMRYRSTLFRGNILWLFYRYHIRSLHFFVPEERLLVLNWVGVKNPFLFHGGLHEYCNLTYRIIFNRSHHKKKLTWYIIITKNWPRNL